MTPEVQPADVRSIRPTHASRALLLTPRVLFVVMTAVLLAGMVLRARHGGTGVRVESVALLAAYLLWLCSEVPITFRQPPQNTADSRTLLPYATSRLCLLCAAAFGPSTWSRWSIWLVAPAAVFVFGVVLRRVAIRTLGSRYSHHVVRQSDRNVVTWGPYRIIRHPAYAGMLTANLGFAVYFLNVLTVPALVLLIMAVTWRIRVEERALGDVPAYVEYAAGKPRLLPGMW